MSPGTDVAPGTFTNFDFFRTGDYGGMSVDPTDGVTFWASHEYAGNNPVYNTFIASFTVAHAQDEDWYSHATNMGDVLNVNITLPGSSSGGQFANTLSPVIQLYDPNGNLVASGTTSLTYTALMSGNYAIRVQGASNTQGEYILGVSTGMSMMRVLPRSISAPSLAAPAAQIASNHSQFATAAVGGAVLQGMSNVLTLSPVSAKASSVSSTVTPASTPNVAPAAAVQTAPTSTIASDAFFTMLGRSTNQSAAASLLTSLALSGDIQTELD
jgi:hypothetical protein